MAKAKNQAATPAPGTHRVDTGIERAENGFIVRTTSEGKGKNAGFTSRTFVAPNRQSAMRIAATHIQCVGKKLKGKKGKTKAAAAKR